jgi:hypothetical protein
MAPSPGITYLPSVGVLLITEGQPCKPCGECVPTADASVCLWRHWHALLNAAETSPQRSTSTTERWNCLLSELKDGPHVQPRLQLSPRCHMAPEAKSED